MKKLHLFLAILCLYLFANIDANCATINLQEKGNSNKYCHRKRGPRGHRGKKGDRGKRGKTGATGATGAQGIAGPIGPTGTGGINNFITAVVFGNTPPATSTQSVANSNPILFTTTTDTSGTIGFVPGTGTFTVPNTGHYEITFGARFTSDDGDVNPVITLRLNGGGNALTNISVRQGSLDWAVFSCILPLNAGDTVEVIASSINGSADIVLVDPFTGSTTSAFITIKQIR